MNAADTIGWWGEPAPGAAGERLEIALFPLNCVLFPGGMLPLKVFEQRYLDMSADCLRRKQPFGVCLIAAGKEVGEAATPCAVGTLARIRHADMEQAGILHMSVQGQCRFRILDSAVRADRLLTATVELLGEPAERRVAERDRRSLVPLLRRIIDDLGPERMPPPHAYNDACWVGYRLAEVLPVQALAKQKLLELDDPAARLEVIHSYLAQRKLVS